MITAVRLWRHVGPVSQTGNLVIYEDCLVFATAGRRDNGWLSRIVAESSTLDGQLLRVGREQVMVEPRRLALCSRRNLLIHRDQVEYAKLTQRRVGGTDIGDDVVGAALGLIAEIGAPTRQVLSIRLQGVRAKLTIQGTWGTPESESLQHALGEKLVAGHR